MIYPDFNELIALKASAMHMSFSSRKKVASNMSGDYISPFRGQGLDFEEVREYRPGDDVRNIDWRVTARSGVAHTKIFKEERQRTSLLCIDVNTYMRFATRGTFKSVRAAQVAALLAWQANKENDQLGACLFGDVPAQKAIGLEYIKPNKSRKSIMTLFKTLSDRNINESASQIDMDVAINHLNKVAPTGSVIYVISDFNHTPAELEKQISLLKKRCTIVFIAINDVSDHTIPDIGSLMFRQDEKQKLYVNTSNNKAREKYYNDWHEMRVKLKELTVKYNIGLISLNTNDDLLYELIFGFKQIKNRIK